MTTTVTGWSGLYNDVNPGGYSLIYDKWPQRNRIRRVVNREAFRAFTELFDSLIGAAAGGTAAATHKRVAGFSPDPAGPVGGGLRTVETVTDINRTTTSQDVANLKEMTFNVTTAPNPYPVNLSGPVFENI